MALLSSDTLLIFMGSSYAAATAAQRALADLLAPIACNLVKEYVGYEIELATITEYHPDKSTPVDDDQLVYGWEVVGGKAVPMDYRTQKARSILQLRNLPVREIVTLYESPSAWDVSPPDWPSGTLLEEGTHYQVDYESTGKPGVDPLYPKVCLNGHVRRKVGVWSPIQRATKIEYVAGYTETELATRFSHFKAAAMIAGTFFMKEAKLMALAGGSTGILTAETIGTWAQTFAPPAQLNHLGLTYDLPPAARRMLEGKVSMTKYI